VLWPLGGVAYVAPPQRPGATLWSIAAGPLVNVVLFFGLFGLLMMGRTIGLAETAPDFFQFLRAIYYVNFGLLVFNLLPNLSARWWSDLAFIALFRDGTRQQPDGSFHHRICRSGRCCFSRPGGCGRFGSASSRFYPLELLARIASTRACWRGPIGCPGGTDSGVRAATPRRRLARGGPAASVGSPLTPFETMAICPNAAPQFETTRCLDCGETHPISTWLIPPPPVA